MREVNESHMMNQSFTSMLNDVCPSYDVSSRQHQRDVTNREQHHQNYDVAKQVMPRGNSNLHLNNQMSVAGFNQNFGASNSYQVFRRFY